MAYVSYDRKSKINVYNQLPNYLKGCATVSAGMCVKKSPEQLIEAGFDIDYCDWSGIAKKYDYTLASDDSASAQKLFDILKSEYPAVVKVNDKDDHWVVVYKYDGQDAPITSSGFTCADPNGGVTKTLTQVTNYINIYKTRTFKK